LVSPQARAGTDRERTASEVAAEAPLPPDLRDARANVASSPIGIIVSRNFADSCGSDELRRCYTFQPFYACLRRVNAVVTRIVNFSLIRLLTLAGGSVEIWWRYADKPIATGFWWIDAVVA
jgi:hypothetical protein